MSKNSARKESVTPPPKKKLQEELERQEAIRRTVQPYNAPRKANNFVNAAVHLQRALSAVPPFIPDVWQQIFDALEDITEQFQRVLVHYSLVDRVQGNGSIAWPGPWPPPPIPPELLLALEKSAERLERYLNQFAQVDFGEKARPDITPLSRVAASVAHLAEQIRDWLIPIAPKANNGNPSMPESKKPPPMSPDQRLVFDLLNNLPIGEGMTGTETHRQYQPLTGERVALSACHRVRPGSYCTGE